jgi:hypothetical protein
MAPWGFLPGCRIDGYENRRSLVMRTADTVATLLPSPASLSSTEQRPVDMNRKLTESKISMAD